ncbi:hypothetical protein VTJ04DRAFT_3643 [Mycothermus thermophilus]|uniref:uncharacterized protein n=1 Tax=Humicola insolens TaxID=85995 RepID=UPI003741F31B
MIVLSNRGNTKANKKQDVPRLYGYPMSIVIDQRSRPREVEVSRIACLGVLYQLPSHPSVLNYLSPLFCYHPSLFLISLAFRLVIAPIIRFGKSSCFPPSLECVAATLEGGWVSCWFTQLSC